MISAFFGAFFGVVFVLGGALFFSHRMQRLQFQQQQMMLEQMVVLATVQPAPIEGASDVN